MTDKKTLFVSFAHYTGFGNTVIEDFAVFNTEVWGALQSQATDAYVIGHVQSYIENTMKVKDVVILNFIWIDR